jgi:hypothetical protein
MAILGESVREGDRRRFVANLILESDTVWCFSGKVVMIQENAERCKALIIKVGITCDDS